jgi:hypothetical protein
MFGRASVASQCLGARQLLHNVWARGRTLGEVHREGAAPEEALEAYAKALSVTERVRTHARARVGGMQRPSGTRGGLGDVRLVRGEGRGVST